MSKSVNDHELDPKRVVRLSTHWDNIIGERPTRTHRTILGRDLSEYNYRLKTNLTKKPIKYFCTNSRYKGQWDDVSMTGCGVLIFPHGVVYKGFIVDGKFHGNGVLCYPSGLKIQGIWKYGRQFQRKVIYEDGLSINPRNFTYCKDKDRRFWISVKNNLKPAGRSYLTPLAKSRLIPKGCYDTIDGFYNPKTKCVMSADKPDVVIRIPTTKEDAWIKKHCRKQWDEPTGYRPDLYEDWITDNATIASMCLDTNSDTVDNKEFARKLSSFYRPFQH